MSSRSVNESRGIEKKESSSRGNVKKDSSSRSVTKKEKENGAPKKAEEMKVEELKSSKDDLEEEIKTLIARMDTLPTGKAGRSPREKIQRRIREARAEMAKFNKVDSSFNFVGSSAPGCHIAFSLANGRLESSLNWVVDHHEYDPTEFEHLAEEPTSSRRDKRSSRRRSGSKRSSTRRRSTRRGERVRVSSDSSDDSGSNSSSSKRSSSPDEDSHVPEINVDLETSLLSVYNTSKTITKTFYISLLAPLTPAVDEKGEALTMSTTRTPDGDEIENCCTLICVVGPRRVIDLCFLASTSGLSERSALRHAVKRGSTVVWPPLYSDVKALKSHPDPAFFDETHVYRFPLERRRKKGESEDVAESGVRQGFLCSQGNNGCLSHFYAGTMHALDLECPVGSRVVAVAAGIVTEIRQTSRAGGCHAANLFAWNSITLQLTDGGVHVDYVHIATDSAVVEVGEVVEAGQLLCFSGDVGFCPKPHLHLQMHTSKSMDAPTTRFAFRGVTSDVVFLPEAGRWYDREGQHEAPAHK